mmetsp:Transcript_61505/g.144061  ORF Transcript_61505/g.144061 Transcript_61505/m.144061 type:complete len:1178 (+) Transcript_61505:48-3581(+)
MDFTKVVSDGYASGESTCSTDTGVCCCLAWRIPKAAQAGIRKEHLRALHLEIASFRELVGATSIEVAATNGALQCKDSRHLAISAEDVALRLGQLLCGWCSSQDPVLELTVGMHTGGLDIVHLPGGQRLFVGSALSGATELAAEAKQTLCVHLRASTKVGLRLYEQLRFLNAGEEELFYLDPAVGLGGVSPEVSEPDWPDHNRKDHTVVQTKIEVEKEMRIYEFAALLERHGVEIDRMGKGEVKSLATFHQEVVQARTSQLFQVNGFLERRVERVIVIVVTKSPDGKDLSIRNATDFHRDLRNPSAQQGIEIVIPDGCAWKETLRIEMSDRFGLSRDIQEELLPIEANWFREERKLARSLPIMQTTYRIHKVRIRVANPEREELRGLGLPTMCTFSANDRSHWAWVSAEAGVQNTNSEVLTKLLQDNNIKLDEWPHGSFADLLTEVYETQASTLRVIKGELIRHLRVIKVWLVTEILGVTHLLVTKSKDRPLCMSLERGMTWEQALDQALSTRLGLEASFKKKSIIVDKNSKQFFQEIEYSLSYPGLKTAYHIHEVTCRVADPHTLLGLPEGNDFVISHGATDDSVTTHYTWQPFQAQARLIGRRKKCLKMTLMDKNSATVEELNLPAPKRQLPLPEPMVFSVKDEPNSRLKELMRGRATNWDRAWHAATHICDPEYSLKDYYEDCTASFPELQLFMATENEATSSGRSAADEYQRTLGALFSVYWLMRLHGDGLQSFVYGVGTDWKPLSSLSEVPVRSADDLRRRQAFFHSADIGQIGKILVSAGLFQGGFCNGANDPERTLALLVLTAIHDIMKMENLLPTVQPEHDGYHGYAAGDVIGDHDHALCYVMDHFPDLLPSFKDLDPAEKQSLQFTQCNLCFNHGWLVQAEAPPGAIFTKFREAMAKDRRLRAGARDVALYFVHWLTDLAGAEPTPLGGCEKFVIKFPLHVLNNFLQSFTYVEGIASETETQVMEKYLKYRWADHVPSLGELPSGPDALAAMRLLCMAQANGRTVVEAFNQELPREDKEVLSMEMGRTGCAGQGFSPTLVPAEILVRPAGPAFLIYYGPAFLQALGSDPAVLRLRILTEIYRCARELWPESQTSVATSVHVRIDTIKGLNVMEIHDVLLKGELWLVTKHNETEAFVERSSHKKLNKLVRGGQKFQILDLGFLRESRRQ